MEKMLFVNVGGGKVTDKRTWSGIPYSLYTVLRTRYDVETLEIDLKKNYLDKLYIAFRRYVMGQSCKWQFTKRFAKRASKLLGDRLSSGNRPDVVFVIGSACLAYLKTDLLIVYFSDAVFSSMVDYYYFGLNKAEIDEYNMVQANALNNASLVALASQWAKDAAVNDYAIPEQKVKVIHLGSNIEGGTEIRRLDHEGINLLFVGADLERKGIVVALEAVRLCNERDSSHSYTLHVVGGALGNITPDQRKYAREYGFINRNDPEQLAVLNHLRATSDLFILPTKAECAGIVFAEACECGIPSIAYRTGGVGDYIRDGETGYLIDADAGADAFADRIITLVGSAQLLDKMKHNARDYYEKDLNWRHTGEYIVTEIRNTRGMDQ